MRIILFRASEHQIVGPSAPKSRHTGWVGFRMAIAALVFSVLALVCSGIAVFYAHRQTRAQEGQFDLATRPQVDCSVDAHKTSDPRTAGVLTVTYVDGPALDELSVEIVVPDDPPYELSMPTFGPGNHSRFAAIGDVRVGERKTVEVILNPSPPSDVAVLRFSARAGRRQSWEWSEKVKIDRHIPPRVVVLD